MHTGSTKTQTRQHDLKQALKFLTIVSDPVAVAVIETLKEEGSCTLQAIAELSNRKLLVVAKIVNELVSADFLFVSKQQGEDNKIYQLNHQRLWRVYAAAVRLNQINTSLTTQSEKR